MKNLTLAAIGLVASAGASLAGNFTTVPPVVIDIVEPPMRAGSGAWLIPLVIVAVLALALTKK